LPALPLTLLIAASAALTIRAEHRNARRAVYLFKPLTTVLVLALAATAPQPVWRGYQALVCAGLLFSLAGDVFLMLPRDRFVAGLASFLIAHLFYVASVLACERFRLRSAYGQAVVLGTYFAAQWLIASSVSTTPFGR
jgi:uncharacterized membrane protein YhhN